jgi:hypothetical protein
MNPYDLKNLNFILSLNSEDIGPWLETQTEDDRLYAQELLDSFERELDVQEAMANPTEDVSDAAEVLKKFTLPKV